MNVKGLLSTILLLLFSANSFAEWRYEAVNDKMSDETVYTADTLSLNTLNFGFPYSGAQKATLTIRRHPRYGLDVIVSIAKGQILCSLYRDCSVSIKYDSNPLVRDKAIGSSDNSSELIFLRDPYYILPKLSSSNKFLIEIPIYQEGNVLLEFNTKGLDLDNFWKLSKTKKPSEGPSENADSGDSKELISQYVSLIQQRINRYWVKPSGSEYENLSTKLKINLIPGGGVVRVSVTKSSGDPLFDQSVENAVYNAAPMPIPADPQVAEKFREIELTFSGG